MIGEKLYSSRPSLIFVIITIEEEQSDLISLEIKSASFQLLQVSPVEWLKFVEDDVHNGFYPVAVKGASKEYWSVTPDQGYKL
ncbi:hypothetical protein P8452_55940 [Trifolium repens]|nr:hypothetical protein P8452_55940 [Trifolium repens]